MITYRPTTDAECGFNFSSILKMFINRNIDDNPKKSVHCIHDHGKVFTFLSIAGFSNHFLITVIASRLGKNYIYTNRKQDF